MNGDGFLDLVAVEEANANIYKNQQNGTFAAMGPLGTNLFDDVVVGDLTGAGALDAFTSFFPGLTGYPPQQGRALVGNGSGNLYLNLPLLPASLNTYLVRLGDFNEDGRLDVAYTGRNYGLPFGVGDPNGVAFEYWLQIPGPPIWSVPAQDFGTLILHAGQLSGQQQLLTETLSNSGPGALDIINICSRPPNPNVVGTSPTAAGSNACSAGPGPVQTNFPISTAASTCPLNGGSLPSGTNCSVVLSFQPSTFGTFSEVLSVVDDANGVPGSVQNVTLTGTAVELDANVQSPINADGSSVFNSQRGVVPVKFTLQENFVTKAPGPPSCQLPPATIGIIRTAGGAIGPVDTSVFEMAADTGANFRIDTTNCQYIYNVDARSLGPGTYSVQIFVNPADLGGRAPGPVGIGSATFGLR